MRRRVAQVALVVVASIVLAIGASFGFPVLAFFFPGDQPTCGGG